LLGIVNKKILVKRNSDAVFCFFIQKLLELLLGNPVVKYCHKINLIPFGKPLKMIGCLQGKPNYGVKI